MDLTSTNYCPTCEKQTDHSQHDKGFGTVVGLILTLVSFGLFLPFYLYFLFKKRYTLCLSCGQLNKDSLNSAMPIER
jgi:hypothetical protein